MEESRERLGSRLGFILLSAGCAIGCGNVWKFPTTAGQNGGGGFVLIYLICLLLLGLPVMTMEFAMGRAAQTSPVKMFQKLQRPGQKWGAYSGIALLGNTALMSFYTVVSGWILYYFVKFLTGNYRDLMVVENKQPPFVNMITNAQINVIYLAIIVVLGFGILCFGLQKGLERVTKYMMLILLALMIGLSIYIGTRPGAGAGYSFYLKPDFGKITPQVIVAAMNQAFFTLSLGIGSMAIFGSYIGKGRSLMGESVNIILLDTFVAIMAGLIIFPACAINGLKVNDGPGLLFNTMAMVFNKMGTAGHWLGTLFFLFMVFAALSTVLAVCENILAMVRDLTGWSRPKGCLVCGIGIFCLALTTALGYSTLGNFHPFGADSAFLDLWDFIVSTNLLPLGSLVIVFFCTCKIGWGWENFKAEANQGRGIKVKDWMRPLFCAVPIVILALYIYGLVTFPWK
ncbi:MAG: sodium-dependent transporter [Clostridia bacterium]|nr:sodium-dependent transporter [Clostridia bacterium]